MAIKKSADAGRPNYDQPQRSRHAFRNSLWIAAASLMLLILGGTLRQSWIRMAYNPGPLSTAHQAYGDQCTACHATAIDSLSLLHQAGRLLTGAPSGRGDIVDGRVDAQCASCHNVPAELRTNPHTMLPSGNSDHWARLGLDDRDTQPISCIACHGEHLGDDLPEPATCTTCHEVDPSSFETVHADKVTFASGKGTRYQFDHATHQLDYFRRSETSFACQTCHNGREGVVAFARNSFERACGACHADALQASSWTAMALPGVDVETIDGEGLGVGVWPQDAGIDLSTPVSASSALWFGDEARATLDSLRDQGVYLNDLWGYEAAAPSVTAIVREIKTLMAALEVDGADALAARLRARGIRNLPQPWLEEAAAAFQQAGLAWLPGAGTELAQFQSTGQWPLWDEYDDYDLADKALGAWTVDTRRFELRYTPLGHADPIMRRLLEASTRDERLRAELANPRVAGACLQCHATGSGQMDWGYRVQTVDTSALRVGQVRGTFDHEPHLEVQQCADCHRPSRNGLVPFDPIPVTTCATCHGTETTSLNCAACHGYHATTPWVSEDVLRTHTPLRASR